MPALRFSPVWGPVWEVGVRAAEKWPGDGTVGWDCWIWPAKGTPFGGDGGREVRPGRAGLAGN